MSLINQSVKRVIKTTMVVVTACMAVLSTSTLADEKIYRLKLAETWGPNFPIFGDATKNMAAMAEKCQTVAYKFVSTLPINIKRR